MVVCEGTFVAPSEVNEVINLLRERLPLRSEHREDVLCRTLELIDKLSDCKDIRALGRLQVAIDKMKPSSTDTQVVLHACSCARKGIDA